MWGEISRALGFTLIWVLSPLRKSLPHDPIASDFILKQVSGSLTIIFVDILGNNEALCRRWQMQPSDRAG